MAAPKGNQNALGNEGGRQKEYDRIAIGKEMIEWSKRPDALTVPMFATSKGLHSGILRNWANEDVEFRSLFLAAKENVGINRLKAVTNPDIKLDPGIYKQTMHFYDLDIKEDVHDEKRFEASLKTPQDAQKEIIVKMVDFSKGS
jgi:hypothetical protein